MLEILSNPRGKITALPGLTLSEVSKAVRIKGEVSN